MALKKIELDEAERMAIDIFLSEHWAAFSKLAEEYMTPDEVEALIEKLSGV